VAGSHKEFTALRHPQLGSVPGANIGAVQQAQTLHGACTHINIKQLKLVRQNSHPSTGS